METGTSFWSQCSLPPANTAGWASAAARLSIHAFIMVPSPTSAPNTTIRTTHFFTDGFLLETREGSGSDMAGNILPHYRGPSKELLRKVPRKP